MSFPDFVDYFAHYLQKADTEYTYIIVHTFVQSRSQSTINQYNRYDRKLILSMHCCHFSNCRSGRGFKSSCNYIQFRMKDLQESCRNVRESFILSRKWDSNPRLAHYEWATLPTELFRHCFLERCKYRTFFRKGKQKAENFNSPLLSFYFFSFQKWPSLLRTYTAPSAGTSALIW